MVVEITDFSDTRLDVFARMTENQLLNRAEPDKGLFIAESPNVTERALAAGCIPVSLLLEKKHIEGEAKHLIGLVHDINPEIPVFTAESKVLSQLTGFPMTRGVLCAMRRPKLPELSGLLENCSRIVVLEHVVNPTNVGAIFRSAAALGMDAVLLTPDCSNPLYRRAIRVSMGTVFQIPWTYLGENASCRPQQKITDLKEAGFKTVAFALRDDSVAIDDPRLAAENKLAVILGTEGDGLAAETMAACDYTVKIPMSHNVDSLNVAAASAVAFWVLGKKEQNLL